MNEETTRKVVGLLIQVLHGEYSDTRDLAVAQLVSLGERVVPMVCAYLREEGEREKDLLNYYNWYKKRSSLVKGLSFVEYLPGHEEANKMVEQLREAFKKRWGHDPSHYTGYPYDDLTKPDPGFPYSREFAVDGALKALGMIGDSRALPTLEQLPLQPLPVSRYDVSRPLFEKVNETMELIRSKGKQTASGKSSSG